MTPTPNSTSARMDARILYETLAFGDKVLPVAEQRTGLGHRPARPVDLHSIDPLDSPQTERRLALTFGEIAAAAVHPLGLRYRGTGHSDQRTNSVPIRLRADRSNSYPMIAVAALVAKED